MKLDTERAGGQAVLEGGGRVRQRADRDGGDVRRLKADGSDLDGIHYLRTFGNADAIRSDALRGRPRGAGRRQLHRLRAGGHVDRRSGVKCSILMQEEVVLERVLGRRGGRLGAATSSSRAGWRCTASDELERFEGVGRARPAGDLQGGLSLDCGCVAIGAGVTPDVMLARVRRPGRWASAAAWRARRGSRRRCPASTPPATWPSRSPRCTAAPALVEHFEVAVEQGRTAAVNMAGRRTRSIDDGPVLLVRPGRLGDDRVRRHRRGGGRDPRLARRTATSPPSTSTAHA